MTTPTDHPLYPDGRPPEVVCLVGDLHGNIAAAQRAIQAATGHTRLLIQLGDFGFYDEPDVRAHYLTSLDRLLQTHGMRLAWLDGNHENHTLLNDITIDPRTGMRRITDRIWHLPRGYRWTWAETTWMAVGGAVSVDKDSRIPGVSWWPQEELTDADVERISTTGPVGVLLTHDAPAGITIPGITDLERQLPRRIAAEANDHRQRLREIVDAVTPCYLWHGHYHRRYISTLDLGLVKDSDRLVHVQGLADDSTAAANFAFISNAGSLAASDSDFIGTD